MHMSTFGGHMRALLTLVLGQLSFQKVIHKRSRNHTFRINSIHFP